MNLKRGMTMTTNIIVGIALATIGFIVGRTTGRAEMLDRVLFKLVRGKI